MGTRIDQLEAIPEAYKQDLVLCCLDVPLPLGANWYFFGMERGNHFYFECDGNPNPKVWMMPDLKRRMEVYPSFPDLLKEELEVIWKVTM